jgi:hypothetical protein
MTPNGAVTVRVLGVAQRKELSRLIDSLRSADGLIVSGPDAEWDEGAAEFKFKVEAEEGSLALLRAVIDFYSRAWGPGSAIFTMLREDTATDIRRFTDAEEAVAERVEGQILEAERAEANCQVTT